MERIQLSFLVLKNDVDTIKLLMQNGVNFNVTDKLGWTPLHYAVLSQNLELTIMFLEAGVDPNIQGTFPRYIEPFDIEVLRQFVPASVFDIIKRHEIDCSIRRYCRHNTLYLATRCYHLAPNFNIKTYYTILKLLMDFNVNTCFDISRKNSYFHLVLRYKSNRLLDFFLNTKVKLTDLCFNKRDCPCLLFTTSLYPDLSIFKFLVDSGHIDINKTNTQGITALHIAVMQNRYEPVEYLIKKGAKVDTPCETGSTALGFAMQYHYADLVMLLLNNGADIAKAAESPVLFRPRGLDWKSRENFDICLAEIQLMKQTNLLGCVSLYDILSRNVSIPRKEEKRLNEFCEQISHANFPIFHALLVEKLRKMINRIELEKESTEHVAYVLGLDEYGFHMVIETVINFLDDNDLRCLKEI